MHFTLPESWTRTKSIQTGVRGFPALKLLPIQVCWPLGLARLEFALALFTRRRWGLKDCSASLHLSADLIRLPLLLQPQDLVGLERTGSQSLCPSPPPHFFFSPSALLSFCLSPSPSSQSPCPVPSRGACRSEAQTSWVEVGGVQHKPCRGAPGGAATAGRNRNRLPLQKPAPGLFRPLSRVLYLGLLRLGFLLRLGSPREEQGQVPGKSPGMRGSFPAVGRGLSSLLPGIPGIQHSPVKASAGAGAGAAAGRPGASWRAVAHSPGARQRPPGLHWIRPEKVAFPEIGLRPTRGLAP